MGKRKTRFLVLALSLLFAAFSLSACSDDSSNTSNTASSGGSAPAAAAPAAPAATGKAPAAGPGTLTVALIGQPPNLTTVEHNSQMGEMFNMQMYNSLFYIGDNFEMMPDLAESYENVSPTEWIFKLRKGVKFHNGAEMKAADVVASLERARATRQVARFAEHFVKIEALDDYTVKITTDMPYSETLHDLSHTGNSIAPKALIDSGHDFNAQPVGTGPFQFKAWARGDSLTLERFDDYFNKDRAAQVQTIIFKFIPEGSSRTIALEAGEIDVIHQVEFMDLEKLKANPALTVIARDTVSVVHLSLNNEKPGLDNTLVRKALNAALDRDLVVIAALNGNGTPAYAQVPQGMPGSSANGADGFNLELAKRYMQESGVNPATLDITIICSDEIKRRSAEVAQAAWAELGVNAKIEMMELATYLNQTSQGNFTACMGGYSTKSLLSWIKSTFGAASIGAVNKSRINDAAINAQISVCDGTLDPATLAAEMEKLSTMCNESATNVPLYQETMFKAFNANVQGIAMAPNGTVYYSLVGWK